MIKLNCQKCGKEYLTKGYKILTSKHCSRVCHNSVAGVLGGLAGKGVTRGNGVKRPYLSERNKLVRYKGEKHPNWKGDNVGYIALHVWVRKNFGKAKKCERCNAKKNVQWANKSKTYKREIGDWMPLCSSCHQKYDKTETKNVISKFKNHKLNPLFNNGYTSV